MTHLPPDPLPDSADHWLAYRYLTGELSDDEAAACDARLADDLSLQVALAECVSLTSGLARLSRRAAVSPSSRGATGRGTTGRGDSPRRTPVLAAAALGLLAVGLMFTSALVAPQQMAWLDRETSAPQVLDPSSVVAMWSQLADEGDSSERPDRSMKFDAADDEDLDIPDWMLVAVLKESEDGEDTESLQEHQL